MDTAWLLLAALGHRARIELSTMPARVGVCGIGASTWLSLLKLYSSIRYLELLELGRLDQV
jgi:hypothetical protein